MVFALSVLVFAAAWAGFLTFISVVPRPPVPSSPVPLGLSWAFAAHFGGYLALALLLAVGLPLARGSPSRVWPKALMAGLGAALYGALMEVTQIAVPGRFAAVQDGFANAAGALVGALLGLAALAIVSRLRRPWGAGHD